MVEGDDDLLRFLDRDAAGVAFSERVANAMLVDKKVSTAPHAISLMITNRQRGDLHTLGFSEHAIRRMTPVEAHGHLGLNKPER
ncbi:hypothetical protein [Methylobacterium sp. V23]|uniref:hypothetical protein n=1 Tax=Methylobacterium sp. V23 TaxID=2044878 RepID=UPI000CDA7E56|nr:hypothetical protein [Methylobacterium sp. V23]POR40841.1 hypothetical protein CRT23_21555 [Methylobacterium sp. V23]